MVDRCVSAKALIPVRLLQRGRAGTGEFRPAAFRAFGERAKGLISAMLADENVVFGDRRRRVEEIAAVGWMARQRRRRRGWSRLFLCQTPAARAFLEIES